jgi:eukaryotic-like serine/threonine-protein kinase
MVPVRDEAVGPHVMTNRPVTVIPISVAVKLSLIGMTMLTETDPETQAANLVRTCLDSLLADRYAITDVAGHGSSAIVFAARELRYDRSVALKALSPYHSFALTEVRFHREIRLLARLTHPCLLPLYDSGDADGIPYYVTPLVDGGSLRQRLHRCGPLAICEAVRIAADVAGALDYVHRADIVHRDVKPENILLSGRRAVLADFGVALPMRPLSVHGLTETGMGSPGTPLYMSPEQAVPGVGLDGRSDMYSLGLVLFEMLVGTLPFRHTDKMTAYAWRYVIEAPDVRSLRADVPETVAQTLGRALRREPDERFATMADLAAALRTSC